MKKSTVKETIGSNCTYIYKASDNISASEKSHSEYVNELELQNRTMKKSIKMEEKEVHNLKFRFTNFQDANTDLIA